MLLLGDYRDVGIKVGVEGAQVSRGTSLKKKLSLSK